LPRHPRPTNVIEAAPAVVRAGCVQSFDQLGFGLEQVGPLL
jgi:hypothetical protein